MTTELLSKREIDIIARFARDKYAAVALTTHVLGLKQRDQRPRRGFGAWRERMDAMRMAQREQERD